MSLGVIRRKRVLTFLLELLSKVGATYSPAGLQVPQRDMCFSFSVRNGQEIRWNTEKEINISSQYQKYVRTERSP